MFRIKKPPAIMYLNQHITERQMLSSCGAGTLRKMGEKGEKTCLYQKGDLTDWGVGYQFGCDYKEDSAVYRSFADCCCTGYRLRADQPVPAQTVWCNLTA